MHLGKSGEAKRSLSVQAKTPGQFSHIKIDSKPICLKVKLHLLTLCLQDPMALYRPSSSIDIVIGSSQIIHDSVHKSGPGKISLFTFRIPDVVASSIIRLHSVQIVV